MKNFYHLNFENKMTKEKLNFRQLQKSEIGTLCQSNDLKSDHLHNE